MVGFKGHAYVSRGNNVSISSPSSEGGGLRDELFRYCSALEEFPLVLLQAKVVGFFQTKDSKSNSLNVSISSPSSEGGGRIFYEWVEGSSPVSISSPSSEGGGRKLD